MTYVVGCSPHKDDACALSLAASVRPIRRTRSCSHCRPAKWAGRGGQRDRR